MVKTDLESIKRIVAFGCSFTAGTELLDHTIGEKYRDLKTKSDPYTWYAAIKEDPIAIAKLVENREKEKGLSWAAKLATNLNLDFESHAIPGNANEKVIWQIEKLIFENKILPNDLVIIGLSSPHRFIHFDPKSYEPIPFVLSNESDITNRYGKKIYNFFNDGNLVWNYIRTLETMEYLRNKLNGRLKIILMEEPFRINGYHYYDLHDLGHQEDFFRFKIDSLINSELILTTEVCLYDFCQGETLEHKHPTEKAHQQFADALVPYFIKKS